MPVRLWELKYGYARPPSSWRVGENRYIAVGSKLFSSTKWATLHDFLPYYAKRKLGWAWGQAELGKPHSHRHPIMQWFDAAGRLHESAYPANEERDANIVRVQPLTAGASAWHRFAYDLYLTDDAGVLTSRLLQRLKNAHSFQGARYELMIAGELLRAGFQLNPIDERISKKRLGEWNAIHRSSGDAFSVEVKSVSRPGYLGRDGEPKTISSMGKALGRLLRDALLKEADHERIIFLEVNMPPSYQKGFWTEAATEHLAFVDDQSRDHARPLPPAYVVFTNRPNHLVELDAPEPQPTHGFTAIGIPAFRSGDPDQVQEHLARRPALLALHHSLKRQEIPYEWGPLDLAP